MPNLISWTTNIAASSQVEYGLTTAYGSLTPLDPRRTLTHAVQLLGLTPSTAYHYRVRGRDSAGTELVGADHTFTSAAAAAIVGSVSAQVPIVSGSVVGGVLTFAVGNRITWTTSISASSQVEYGLTTAYGTLTPLDPARVLTHTVLLTGLAPGTLYHYRVRGRNVAGTELIGVDQTFTASATSAAAAAISIPVPAMLATGACTWIATGVLAIQPPRVFVPPPSPVSGSGATTSRLAAPTIVEFLGLYSPPVPSFFLFPPPTALAFGAVINPPPAHSVHTVFTWIDPSLIEHQLSGLSDLDIIQGRTGLHMPPVRISEDALPGNRGGGGSRLRDHIYESREIDLPLFLYCKDYETLWARHSEVSSWFRLRRDNSGRPLPGRLRVMRPDGTEREIVCVYSGGLHGTEGSGVSGPSFRRMILVLVASDPLWYARNPVQLTFTMIAGPTFFSTPFLPLHLGASEVASGAIASNPGEETCWPVWQIVGPGVNPVLSNNTTGSSLSLTLALTAGQSVTIDTRPTAKSIVNDQTGVNLYSALAPGSATMWPLEPGNNDVQVLMGGATSVSRLNLTFTPTFLGA